MWSVEKDEKTCIEIPRIFELNPAKFSTLRLACDVVEEEVVCIDVGVGVGAVAYIDADVLDTLTVL